MQFCFKGQIGCNLEVYIDDIVVKSQRGDNLIADLEETFNNLRRFNIKLNLEKCTFGVTRGKLLRYIITERNIDVNPDKISAIARIGQVWNVKDVYRFMGFLAALSHFVSRLGERGLPLYKLLKKSDSFCWTDEMQKALDEIKALISKTPVLASPEPGETPLLYITATSQVISVALVVEREELGHVYKVQRPVYYINKVLSNCKTRYNQVQKLLYAILITKRKLLHYFESRPIRVITSFRLGEIIGNCLAMGRIAK
jgi:hypothetical protein